jgi:alkanesulfonate monooxygenase SsuD/methylene tetrahydromethanopterin reductase-like flavin-dependent oxidoreductase (luciferase family)
MLYENPLYMAEEAAATDLVSGGRLPLAVSRGSPEPPLRGDEAFGYDTTGETDSDVARRKIARFRQAIAGTGLVEADPALAVNHVTVMREPARRRAPYGYVRRSTCWGWSPIWLVNWFVSK